MLGYGPKGFILYAENAAEPLLAAGDDLEIFYFSLPKALTFPSELEI